MYLQCEGNLPRRGITRTSRRDELLQEKLIIWCVFLTSREDSILKQSVCMKSQKPFRSFTLLKHFKKLLTCATLLGYLCLKRLNIRDPNF